MNSILLSAFSLFFLQTFVTPITEDDAARSKIKDAYTIGKIIAEEGMATIEDKQYRQLMRTLMNSIDLECVFQEYKKHDFLDDLVGGVEIMEKISELHSTSKKDQKLLRLAAIGITCSCKIEPILKFAFDSLVVAAELAQAFRDDPPVDEVYSNFICYSNYVINHGLVNANGYENVIRPLVNQTQEECDQKVVKIMNTFPVLRKDERSSDLIEAANEECMSSELMAYVYKMLFKANVLMQVELSDSEKSLERKGFINGFHSFVKKFVFCTPSVLKNVTLEA